MHTKILGKKAERRLLERKEWRRRTHPNQRRAGESGRTLVSSFVGSLAISLLQMCREQREENEIKTVPLRESFSLWVSPFSPHFGRNPKSKV